MATFRMRSGLRKSDQNPHSSRLCVQETPYVLTVLNFADGDR